MVLMHLLRGITDCTDLLDRTRLMFLNSCAGFWLWTQPLFKHFWQPAQEPLRCGQVPVLHELPPPSMSSMAVWVEFIITHYGSWKTIVRKGHSPDPPKSQKKPAASAATGDDTVFADVSGERLSTPVSGVEDVPPAQDSAAEPAVPSQEKPFACKQCDFASRTRAGLSMHERRKHGVQSEIALRIRGTSCPSCDNPFATRHRVLDHMRDSPRTQVSSMAPREHSPYDH
eukprot:394112-Amphidinium_carterae.1